MAHFYVIAATGFAAQQRRSIPAILALYPSKDEETQHLPPKDAPDESTTAHDKIDPLVVVASDDE